jgi:hypothetical protein
VRITGALTPPSCRQIARDGADLPAQQIVEGPAQTRIPVGITMDFQVTPTAAGDFVLQMDLPRGPVLLAGFATKVPIRVTPAMGESRFDQDQAAQRRILERALTLLADESKWQGQDARRLNLSDLLWTAFCAVEAEPVAREHASAVGSEVLWPAPATRGTRAV